MKEKYFIYSQSLQIKHKFLNICELKRRNMFQIKLMGLHSRHIFPKCFLYFQNFFYIYIRLSKVMFCTCWFQVCFCPRHITIPYFWPYCSRGSLLLYGTWFHLWFLQRPVFALLFCNFPFDFCNLNSSCQGWGLLMLHQNARKYIIS